MRRWGRERSLSSLGVPPPLTPPHVVSKTRLRHDGEGTPRGVRVRRGVRRQVTAEIGRVLKPGGLLVFIDSLQMGDKPGWDGLLEAFPHRFHEPYFRHYSTDDLDGMFEAAGLERDVTSTPFLAKLMARRKR